MKEILEKLVEKMKEEGKPMRDLAEFFINEPLSLEILLMLAYHNSMKTDNISNELMDNVKITDILDKLKGFETVDIDDNIVSITDRGRVIVSKLIDRLEY